MMSHGGEVPRQPPPKVPQLALGNGRWKGSLGVQVMEGVIMCNGNVTQYRCNIILIF